MSNRRQEALAYFVQRGWSLAQASGIVANLEAESGLRPDAVGDGGLAYGIAQWHPDRQEYFAQTFGRPIQDSSIELQLAFVHTELQSTEKRAGDALKACTTAGEAGAIVSSMYERPADREGEANKRAALARRIWDECLSQPAAPIEERGTTVPNTGTIVPQSSTQPESHMGALALLQLFGPILTQLIPQIAPLLGAKGDKVQQYAGVAKTVLDTITATTGATNLQGAVEAMSTDPAMKAKVQAAVVSQPEIIQQMGLVDVGGGVGPARAADTASQTAAKAFWYSPAFWITILVVMPPVDYMVYTVISKMAAPSEQLVTQVVTGLLGLFAVAAAFYYGTTYGSLKKDETIAKQVP